MSAIVTKIVEKYNLNPKMSVSDLSKYTSEFLENLTDDRKRNQARRRLRDGFRFSGDQRGSKAKIINIIEGSCKIAIASPPKDLEEGIIREITKRMLQNRYGFSEDRVNALFSTQENERMEEETIGEMAHRLLRDKLSIRDIRAEAYALALSAKNANAGSSRLSRLRKELRNIGASSQIIEATKFPDITEDANKIQRNNRKKAETKRINYPDHFTLESVKERLDSYDTSTVPDVQALADVMIMLCIRPAELTSLRITDA
ncbi:9514_t:CDS:2, partial [Paraglomus occultum]